MCLMQLRNLSVKRGRKWIIRSLDLEVANGQITVIAGPNGSGKTTLLGAMSQDLPYQGEILINGADAAALKPWQRAQIRGVLPQSCTVSFPFLAGEIVALGLSAGNAAGAGIAGRHIAQVALRRVGLQGYGHRFYDELSGGEQARVQLARVLCQIWRPHYQGQPCWLLLDEPVASLDIEHQLVVMNIAREFACGGGGVVVILHDLNLAAAYADKLVLMRQGRIESEGPPETVMTSQNLQRIYNCRFKVNTIPEGDIPFILPQTITLPGRD